MKIEAQITTVHMAASVMGQADALTLSFEDVMAGLTDNAEPAAEDTDAEIASEESGSAGPFTGFFRELQEKKMEELREKILEEMGLTEEALAKMAPEQRSRVERIIAREITQRLAAQSAMGNGKHAALNRQVLLEGLDPLSL